MLQLPSGFQSRPVPGARFFPTPDCTELAGQASPALPVASCFAQAASHTQTCPALGLRGIPQLQGVREALHVTCPAGPPSQAQVWRELEAVWVGAGREVSRGGSRGWLT